MSQEESTMQFDEFVKYQNWLIDFYPDLKVVIADNSDLDDDQDE